MTAALGWMGSSPDSVAAYKNDTWNATLVILCLVGGGGEREGVRACNVAAGSNIKSSTQSLPAARTWRWYVQE
jgi:hypothetical protein